MPVKTDANPKKDPAGAKRERDAGWGRDSKTGGQGGGPDKKTLDKIKQAYEDPSRQLDTPENARKASKMMESDRWSPKPLPGYLPSYPLADPLYGPMRLAQQLPPSPLNAVTAPLEEAGILPNWAEDMGLEKGPQVGNVKETNYDRNWGAGGPGSNDSGMGDDDDALGAGAAAIASYDNEVVPGQSVEFSDVRLADRRGLDDSENTSPGVAALLPQSTATATSRRRRAPWELA